MAVVAVSGVEPLVPFVPLVPLVPVMPRGPGAPVMVRTAPLANTVPSGESPAERGLTGVKMTWPVLGFAVRTTVSRLAPEDNSKYALSAKPLESLTARVVEPGAAV